MHRITITLEEELLAELDRIIAARGYQNRSSGIWHASGYSRRPPKWRRTSNASLRWFTSMTIACASWQSG